MSNILTRPVTRIQDTPASTWTFQHTCGNNPTVSVKVWVPDVNNVPVLREILPKDISHDNETKTVTITFSSPRTGEVRIA